MNVFEIISNTNIDYKEKKHLLAQAAENTLSYVNLSVKTEKHLKKGILCDIFEGHAPYRPRYILPDYEKYIEKGSEYLGIDPPKDMYEAVNALMIIYQYVPSITGYPVYVGQLDYILEKFIDTVFEKEARNLIKMLLINIEKTLPDAFVHMNIGPKETRSGRIILDIERELKKAVPNISLKYCKDETSPDFAKFAAEVALEIGKPYFVNHKEIKNILGENYGVASCYNTLKIGGGSYTLVRLNLKKAAQEAKDYKDFMDNVLPNVVDSLCEVINARAKFIVEEAKFFETSFLAREGLIDINNFTSMAGVFGLYECIEVLTGLKLGHDEEATKYGEEILEKIKEVIDSIEGYGCFGTFGKIGLHAQSGIDSDIDVTAGVRIKIGNEPSIYDQVKTEGRLHRHFNTGVSDIYIFDKTAKKNIDGVIKIIDAAMKSGIKVFALNTSDSELIRITGYLVKRSDVEKYNRGQVLREDTVKLGAESIKNNKTLDRRVREIE
ncbi:MAG: hypothetical protein JG776_617 [Caloramator sp.]|jgi:YjjI family glycine radical enzyme|uniref:YjjI family glycine radical enzyme n=1 Tax=Caloramator sp. TaxID=1871330 RepID=UPI001D1ACB98|nr:YjjI family glycine radical enzyme [Caloramator sp.]MBZ4662935.1 hypothetical protein [Caloramator sp.]